MTWIHNIWKTIRSFSLGLNIRPVTDKMELLLNLTWLLLAFPAYVLWRDAQSVRCGRTKFTAVQCLLALACLLVMLFPVVSATDDLRAMRAEMEESSSTRITRQSGSEKASASKSQLQPALAVTTQPSISNEQQWLMIAAPPMSRVACAEIDRPVRGPPTSLLS